MLSEHKLKLRLADVPVDGSLTREAGWSGMDVQWLVTAATVGAAEHVVGLTVFQPGATHHVHRHPNAEEAQYLLLGSGIATVGDDEIEQHAGEIVFVPKGEWHGFRNTSGAPTVMLWTYGGASNLESAGYERREES